MTAARMHASYRTPSRRAAHLSAEQLSAALDAKPVGRGKWKAHCVAHQDTRPSLWIKESANGKTLVKCWAGCEQAAVIEALRTRGLWPTGNGAPRVIQPSRPKPADDRALTWLLSDIHLLGDQPAAAQTWLFLQHAVAISSFALERVSRSLKKHRPACRSFVRAWLDQHMTPANEFQEQTA